MIKVADYIMQRLADYGVENIFMITGGGAMHLNNAAGRRFHYICNHHEQASAIGAEGYSRTTGKPAVVLVTTGPGGLNTLTGVMGQWTDSIPVVYLSGQVKFETSLQSCKGTGLRQLGDQEVDIVEVVRPITKYAKCLVEPTEVRRVIEEAWYFATTGRKGPVWIDIPMNVQGALIDEDSLLSYIPALADENAVVPVDAVHLTIQKLGESRRPLIVAGHGIRLAAAREPFLELVRQLSLPVVTTFNGFDLVPSEDPRYVGRIGTIGDRAGNLALQNADFVLMIGTRNNIRQISYNWQSCVREAFVVAVDIDPAELGKPTLVPDLPVCCDAAAFIELLRAKTTDFSREDEQRLWLDRCRKMASRYPVVLPEYADDAKGINPYYFCHQLSLAAREDEIIVTANGTASVAYFQGAIVKDRQRVIWNSGCASMGYDLPAAIGASIGSGNRVICLAGDGSLQMNLQELQTVVHHDLPVKLFVLNNQGYHSIRQTQENFFGHPLVGCDAESGVSFPDMEKISAAFGLPFVRLDKNKGLLDNVNSVLESKGPTVCEVIIDPTQPFSPKVASHRLDDGRIVSRPLEDMAPFLDRDEFLANMLIDPLPESIL